MCLLLTEGVFCLSCEVDLCVKKLYTWRAQLLNIIIEMEHISVLKDEVRTYLEIKDGNVVVDATLGLGACFGYSKAAWKKGVLLAFEQDERNLNEAQKRLKDFEKQIIYFHDNFCHLKLGLLAVFMEKLINSF